MEIPQVQFLQVGRGKKTAYPNLVPAQSPGQLNGRLTMAVQQMQEMNVFRNFKNLQFSQRSHSKRRHLRS